MELSEEDEEEGTVQPVSSSSQEQKDEAVEEQIQEAVEKQKEEALAVTDRLLGIKAERLQAMHLNVKNII